MDKLDFKIKVILWLKKNGFNIPDKKIRVYTYRGEKEVRIYGEPMTIPNQRKSFRERKGERDEQRHGSYGIHERKISNYVHINEKDFENKEEIEFIKEMITNQIYENFRSSQR
jgi:hypothetical protein